MILFLWVVGNCRFQCNDRDAQLLDSKRHKYFELVDVEDVTNVYDISIILHEDVVVFS